MMRRRTRVQDEEEELEEEKSQRYRGSARVDIDSLDFPDAIEMVVDEDNVNKLISLFDGEGCFDGNTRHHIPALISDSNLQHGLEISNLTTDKLFVRDTSSWPELILPADCRLQCLHGRHRTLAAQRMRNPRRLWTVDLYSEDISANLKVFMREEIANDQRPTDGEIYRKIRQHSQNPRAAARYWACLSQNKQLELKRLLHRDDFKAAFDVSVPIPGLWKEGVRLGMIREILGSRCDEELLYSLNGVGRFWTGLFRHDEGAMNRVDYYTVEQLELRIPRASGEDFRYLKKLIEDGKIFSKFDSTERYRIFAELQKIDIPIPTLRTFFDNFKLLRSCANCMKSLVKIPSRSTLYQTMEKAYCPNLQSGGLWLLQKAEDTFEQRSGSPHLHMDLHYQQLFLHILRHLHELCPESIRLEKMGRRARASSIDTAAWYRLAKTAERFGFRSDAISELQERYSPDTAAPVPMQQPLALVVEGKGEDLKRRSGLPFKVAHAESRNLLFLENIYAPIPSRKTGITPFFVMRSAFLNFWGGFEDCMGSVNQPPFAGDLLTRFCSSSTTAQRSGPSRVDSFLDLRGSPQRIAAPSRPPTLSFSTSSHYGQSPPGSAEDTRSFGQEEPLPVEAYTVYEPSPSPLNSELNQEILPQDHITEEPSHTEYSFDNLEEEPRETFSFILRDKDGGQSVQTINKASLVVGTAQNYVSERKLLFDTDLWSLHPQQCLQAARTTGENTFLVLPEGPISINPKLALKMQRSN